MLDERSAIQPFEWIQRGDPAARHALLAIGPEGRVLAASPAAQRWLAHVFGRELRAGDDLRSFTTGQETAELQRDLARAMRGEPVWLVRELKGPAGTMWLEIDYHPVRRADGTLEWILLLVAQVSPDRLSAAVVRQAERRFRDILAEAGLAALTVGSDATIDYCNDTFAGLVGVPRETLLGKALGDFLVSEADRDRVARLARGEAVEEDRSFDALLRTATGALRQVSWSVALRREPEAQHVGLALVCHDLTERQQANARIAAAQRMAAIGKLAANAAHEINNPLALLQANAMFFREQLEGMRAKAALPPAAELDDWATAIGECIAGVERIRNIVTNLSAFAKAVPAPEISDVNPRQELLAAVSVVEPALRGRARLELDLPAELPAVRCEPGALTRAFTQILTNAAQAIPDGAAGENKVSVGARVEGDQLQVRIADTGVGIPREVQGKIFEPFFTTRTAAAGLGLSVARAILSACGGEVGVTSAPGEGATFRVRVPLPSAEPPPATPKTKPPGRRRVLVIDDEPMVGRAIRRILSDYEVFAVTTAREALAELTVHDFDAVLCDLALPDISGAELREKLRETLPALVDRIIFITGGAFTPDMQRFIDRDDITVLSKPLDALELRDALKRLLRRT